MSTSEVAAARVDVNHIKVEDFGETVNLRDSHHARTNFYIKQSRPYFPDNKLRTYIDWPGVFRMAGAIWFFSLFGILWGNISKYIPLGVFLVCLLFFIIFCQHEWVNWKTLPVVLKQPVFPSQPSENNFYKVTITELSGIALENFQAGIGCVKLSQGMIKFQAFNKTAIKRMAKAKCGSRVMLFLFLMTVAWNLFSVVIVFRYSN